MIASLEITERLRCRDHGADFRCRVMGRHVMRFVTEKELSILETHPGDPQTVGKRPAMAPL